MKLREKNPALILIDIQKGFLEEEFWGGNRNNLGTAPALEKTVPALDFPFANGGPGAPVGNEKREPFGGRTAPSGAAAAGSAEDAMRRRARTRWMRTRPA